MGPLQVWLADCYHQCSRDLLVGCSTQPFVSLGSVCLVHVLYIREHSLLMQLSVCWLGGWLGWGEVGWGGGGRILE